MAIADTIARGEVEGTAEHSEAARRVGRLSPREREVLALLAEGLDNGRIGDRLVISAGTVKSHVASILGKLGVENRVQAAVCAVRAGVV